MGDPQEGSGKVPAGSHVCPPAEDQELACRSNNAGAALPPSKSYTRASHVWNLIQNPAGWDLEKCYYREFRRKSRKGKIVSSSHQTIWHTSLKFQHFCLLRIIFPSSYFFFSNLQNWPLSYFSSCATLWSLSTWVTSFFSLIPELIGKKSSQVKNTFPMNAPEWKHLPSLTTWPKQITKRSVAFPSPIILSRNS